MSRALVTGGSGFIGRLLAAELAAAGHQVRVLSRRDVALASGVEVARGDLLSRADLDAALAGCDTVFHCAGEKSDTTRMLAVNTEATRLLAGLAAEHRVSTFCHLSSVGVIGLARQSVVDESTPCQPMNLYERTKLEAERIVAAGIAGAKVVILRPTNVFGAATVTALARPSLVSSVKLSLKAREHAHFVYVRDVVAAALRLAGPEGPAGTFIVSSDEEPGNSVREIQDVIAARRSGAPRPLIALPAGLPYYLRRLRGVPANRGDIVYSSRRLLASGFRFPFGLAAGLRDALGAT